MIINRHNYEEFFLLYVDNELTHADRAAVEEFVQQNPDLADEMQMLQQSVLPDESIAFEQKELLYNQADGITLCNYEDYFMLSVDGELTQQENEDVEKFVLMHPQLQSEYLLLAQTRLEPETIAFAGKESLYRKEGKEKRVIFGTWIKISAAAAIIGLVAFAWIFTQNNSYSPSDSSIATVNKIEKPLREEIKEPVKPAQTEKTVTTLQEKKPIKVVAEIKAKVAKKEEYKGGNNAFAVTPMKNKPEQKVDQAGKTVEVAEITSQKKNIAIDRNVPSKTVEDSNPTAANDDLTQTTFANSNRHDKNGATLATHAVYREIDNQEDDEENSFYIGFTEINKNKLRGLFKKAVTFFEKKNTKNDDGERTIKIAGFEIKSK